MRPSRRRRGSAALLTSRLRSATPHWPPLGTRAERACPASLARSAKHFARLAEEGLCHAVPLGWHGLELGRRLAQRHVDDRVAAQRRHPAPRSSEHEVAGLEPVARREDAVARRRRAAALDVPEHGHAGLVAGALLDLGREHVADAAETDMTERVGLLLLRHLTSLPGRVRELVTLGDDDDRKVLAARVAVHDLRAGVLDADRVLRNEDDVRAAR